MLDLKKLSKALIPLSLMTMTSAFADAEIADNCCPTPCCPKPCCVPQPKPCIDCECYNPSFYDLQCDWGVFVSADFLYWYARETNLAFALGGQSRTIPSASGAGAQVFAVETVRDFYLKSKWKPGFRVGIGMNSDCDGWDIYANYTWYENKTSGSASVPVEDFTFDLSTVPTGGTIPVLNFVGNPWAKGNDINEAFAGGQTVDAHWRLQFNQIDLELGRKYWVSKCVTVRPYVGVRGAWTRTTFNDTAIGVAFGPACFAQDTVTICQSAPPIIDSIHQRNKIWGVGLLGGLQPTFYLGNWCGCGEFSIYGNLEGALLWGRYTSSATQTHIATVTTTFSNAPTQTVVQDFSFPRREHFTRMQGILDLGLGLRWEEHWCCDRYMTSIDLGWEHHYWWDFGLYHRTASTFFDRTSFADNRIRDVVAGNQINFPTNLGFGGLVIRARFDF